jgi:hypothetical protein
MSKSPQAIKEARQLNSKPGFTTNRGIKTLLISSHRLKRGKG